MTLTQRVLIDVEADTSEAVGNFKKLDKAVGDASRGIVASLKETFSSIGALDGQFERLKRGIGDAMGIVGKFSSALRGYANDESLYANTSAFNIGSIQKGLKGLKTETEIMTQVQALSRGEQKLSQAQMETLTTAIAGFEGKGLDAGKAMDIVRQAVVQLSTDGLKEMGIHVDKTGIAMDTQAGRGELLKRVLDSLTDSSKEFAAAQLTAGDEAVKAANKMDDAIARLERTLRKAAATAAKGAEGIGSGWGKYIADIALGEGGIDNLDPANRPSAIYADLANQTQALAYKSANPISLGAATVTPVAAKAKAAGYSRSAQATKTVQQALAALSASLGSDVANLNSALDSGLGSSAGTGAGLVGDDDVTKRLGLEEQRRKWAGNAEAQAAQSAKQKSFLESAFGPIEQFNEYAAAFNILSGAVTSAMDAWITGSESMGTAIKKALASGIKALASELAMQALKHGAYALGSLAFGDVRGAGMHGIAAAKFAAGAAVAAVVARSMGHGGADYGKSAGGGGGGSAGGGAPIPRPPKGSEGGGRDVVYVVGDPFDTETNPRRRQNSAKKIIKQVSGNSAGGSY